MTPTLNERRYVNRYRRASIKRWEEPEFGALSDKAKLLLLFLEQGPFTTSVPGLFSAGPAALAEGLGWASSDLTPRSGSCRPNASPQPTGMNA